MTKEDNEEAWAALQQALEAAPGASERDQAYIRALAKRYSKDFTEDRSQLDKAYASAMRELTKAYPDDLTAQTLFAEALMDTMPWDYWAKDRSPKPETEEAQAALRFVFSRDSNHPGANHLYIHAVEAGPRPEIGLPAADYLTELAPNSGHLLHMPSHIYMRVGQYAKAAEANERAIKADQNYIRSCAAQGFYPGVYYPHNVHFLWWARLFEGRSKEALRAAERAARLANDNVCGPSQVLEAPRFRHLPWLTMTRFGNWEQVLKVPEPPGTNTFIIDRAMWRFTRGLAFCGLRNAEAAEGELSGLRKLAESEELKGVNAPQFPATDIVKVAQLWLGGKVAGAKGDNVEMIRLLKIAVETEEAIPYMEPSYWPIPVRPTLGAALLQTGNAAEAEQVFREDLDRNPRNPWGLLGLNQSLARQGKTESAAIVRRAFKDAWKNADVPLAIEQF